MVTGFQPSVCCKNEKRCYARRNGRSPVIFYLRKKEDTAMNGTMKVAVMEAVTISLT